MAAACIIAALGPSESRAARAAPALLAPAHMCPGSDSLDAAADARRKAVVCLVNYARRQARRTPLRPSTLLSEAAGRKGQAVVGCEQFSHTPCGASATATTTAVGYRFRAWGEALFYGPGGLGAPREAVRQWLLSPPHRATLLARGIRDVGVAVLDLPTFDGQSDVSLWVLQVAARA